MTPAFLAVGHITRDRTPQGERPGGAVAYASLTALRLGYPSAVVTACAPEEAQALRRRGVVVHALSAPSSTVFENIYTPEGRRQSIGAVAPSLGPEAVPPEWRAAPLVLLAPVAGEVDPSLARLFPGALLALSPQGWLRGWDETGRVFFSLPPEGLEEALARSRIVILSEEDAPEDLAEEWARRVPLLVHTRGDKGGRVHWRGRWEPYPALPARTVDPTGAGDVFAAAFLLCYAETGDPREAALFASCAAGLSVQAPGLEGVPPRREVLASLARWGREG